MSRGVHVIAWGAVTGAVRYATPGYVGLYACRLYNALGRFIYDLIYGNGRRC